MQQFRSMRTLSMTNVRVFANQLFGILALIRFAWSAITIEPQQSNMLLMLGFGGSRWTAPYVERYIGLVVSIGIKIGLIYCLVSAGLVSASDGY